MQPDTPATVARRFPRARLEVYVAEHCSTWVESRALARAAAEQFPEVEVVLVDLDSCTVAPEPVVAVPTYLLNGKPLWLGNPTPEELFARLRAPTA